MIGSTAELKLKSVASEWLSPLNCFTSGLESEWALVPIRSAFLLPTLLLLVEIRLTEFYKNFDIAQT